MNLHIFRSASINTARSTPQIIISAYLFTNLPVRDLLGIRPSSTRCDGVIPKPLAVSTVIVTIVVAVALSENWVLTDASHNQACAEVRHKVRLKEITCRISKVLASLLFPDLASRCRGVQCEWVLASYSVLKMAQTTELNYTASLEHSNENTFLSRSELSLDLLICSFKRPRDTQR